MIDCASNSSAVGTVYLADEGVHFFGIAHEMPSERKFMMAIVKHQRAAARLRSFVPPSGRGGGNLPGGGAAGRIGLDADGQGRADRPFFDEIARLFHRRVENEILEYLKWPVICLRRFDEPVRLVEIETHWLLERDNFPGGDGLQRRRKMEMMRQ